VIRRLGVLVVLGALVGACGGKRPTAPAPQTMQEAVTTFLAAVKDSNINRMGELWGSERGPAIRWMEPVKLSQYLMTIHKYWTHVATRIVEGPIAVPGNERLRTFRVELQRSNCTRVVPLDVVRTDAGGWLVKDVHLEAVGNPRLGCPPAGGTRP